MNLHLWTAADDISGTPIPFSAKKTLLDCLPVIHEKGYTPVEMIQRQRLLKILDSAPDNGDVEIPDELFGFLKDRVATTRFRFATDNYLKLIENLS